MEEDLIELTCHNVMTDNILNDAQRIIENARTVVYRSANIVLVQRNWLLGRRIALEEFKGGTRASYGDQVIEKLAKSLTAIYGAGFTKTNLYSFASFHKLFPEIFHALSGKSRQVLSWTHYRVLLQVKEDDARQWYHNEALTQAWSARTLQRNVSSQYYHRMLASHNREAVTNEMKQLTATMQDPLEYIKSPVVAEFLGFSNNTDYTESDLETSILNHLQQFLIELGKGYAFVARQQHIQTEKEDYYIDLVFYNYLLKCFVLIDLKTSKIRHQDVGQMDMYVKMYDTLKRTDGDNPTLGLLLCADTDEDVARYSVLNGNEQLFATKYLTYLPTQEELRREIEQQKMHYLLQHNIDNK
jgi:predicted nuclease of restriction endonuclease-like (RecB) superfamily